MAVRNKNWHSSRDQNEQAIIAEFKAAGAFVTKIASNATTGLPDLIIGHAGKLAFVEIKMPGNPLRADQERFRAECEREGLLWFLADHIDDVLGIMDFLRTGKSRKRHY
jgi:VRR-NUC domain